MPEGVIEFDGLRCAGSATGIAKFAGVLAGKGDELTPLAVEKYARGRPMRTEILVTAGSRRAGATTRP